MSAMSQGADISIMGKPKQKILRVVTAPESVQFHLKNTLEFIWRDFDVAVVGDGVGCFKQQYVHIQWVDIPIPRKIDIAQDFLALLRLYRCFAERKPDIVHSIMPKAGLLSALAGVLSGVPVRIHTFTGQTWAEKKGFSRRFLIFLDWLIVKLNTVCYADSLTQSIYLAENGISLHGKKLPVLGDGSLSGVDLERFDRLNTLSERDEFRKRHHIAAAEIVFVFVGRKCRDKGIFDLIAAFAEVLKSGIKARLLLVGPDESEGEYTRRIHELSLPREALINIGRVDEPEKYMAAGDVFCLPSYREGFGTVVIEAAAMGLPAIGSKIFGLLDSIVEGETGLMIEPGNREGLCMAMKRLAQNKELREQIGEQARQRAAACYSSQRMYSLLRTSYLNYLIKGR